MDSAASMNMMPIYHLENKKKICSVQSLELFVQAAVGCLNSIGNGVRFLHSLYQFIQADLQPTQK